MDGRGYVYGERYNNQVYVKFVKWNLNIYNFLMSWCNDAIFILNFYLGICLFLTGSLYTPQN